jgi:tetratricopeptide (TPR) repeat protein
MKRCLTLVFFSICFIVVNGQDINGMIREGVGLHDEGKYDEAIRIYDSVIAIAPHRYIAYYEKGYSLMKSGKYEDCIDLSKFILKKFPDSSLNAALYVTYGTCYDMLKMPEQSIKIYDEGIKKYPREGLLYFNKAIPLYNTGKPEEALEAAEKSIKNNPYHASSHNLMSQLVQKNKVYSLLASLCFLAIEPTGARAKANIEAVERIIGANVEKKDDKNINITLMMPDEKEKKQENDFHTVEMLMSLSAAMNHSDENKNETRIDRMKRNLESIFAMLSETKKEKGFGWEYYAPFFSDLKKKEYLDVYCHIIYASVGDGVNNKWLDDNTSKVKEFIQWFRGYWD